MALELALSQDRVRPQHPQFGERSIKQLAADFDNFARKNVSTRAKRNWFQQAVDYVVEDIKETWVNFKDGTYPIRNAGEYFKLVFGGVTDNNLASDVAHFRDEIAPFVTPQQVYDRLYDPNYGRHGSKPQPVTMTGTEGGFVPVIEAVNNTLDTFGDSLIDEIEAVHGLNADPSNRNRDTPLLSSNAARRATYGVRAAVAAGLFAVVCGAAITRPMIEGVYEHKQFQLRKQADEQDAAMNYRVPNPAFLEWKLGEKRDRNYLPVSEKFANAGFVSAEVPQRYLKISIYDYEDWSEKHPAVRVINPAYADWHKFAESYNSSIDQGKVPTPADIKKANTVPQIYLSIPSKDFPQWIQDHPEYESIYEDFARN